MKLAINLLFLFTTSSVHAQFSKELLKVANMMQGKFSSEKQAENDSLFYDIRLNIVPIWENRTDAKWMYVEQALATMQDKPYRQRIYKLSELKDGYFESAVYTLEDPLRFVGQGDEIEKLDPDSLTLRIGCSVFLKKVSKKRYEGGTAENTCESNMRGASYASSEVILTPKYLLSWDRGFDTQGKQVWGAETGGYMFRKIKD